MAVAACPAFAGAHQNECGRCTRPAWEHAGRLVNGQALPWPDDLLDQWRAIGLVPDAEPDPGPTLAAETATVRAVPPEGEPTAHNLCAICWNRRHPDRPMIPERLGLGVIEECCGCGNMNNDGVFWWGDGAAAELECANRSEAHAFPLFLDPPPEPEPGQPLLAPYPNKLTR